jgi:ABC-type phosphate transport system substrate-binding protein
MRSRVFGLSFALFVVLATALPAGAESGYRVIVNVANPVTALERRYLADLFLKKATRWPSGGAVRPADQTAESAVRRRFCDEVIGRPLEAVRSYWQQQVFSGRDVPPPELDGDEEVVRYVQKHPGAIGYVSLAADVRSVRVLGVR